VLWCANLTSTASVMAAKNCDVSICESFQLLLTTFHKEAIPASLQVCHVIISNSSSLKGRMVDACRVSDRMWQLTQLARLVVLAVAAAARSTVDATVFSQLESVSHAGQCLGKRVDVHGFLHVVHVPN
jgi:hypothetical protein